MPTRVIGISLLALILGACADEKPDQQLVQKEQEAAASDQRPLQDERRQRTLGQSESERIYNQGGLR
jgi:PBP1b-binding outer membrane lipoprotein LpoB